MRTLPLIALLCLLSAPLAAQTDTTIDPVVETAAEDTQTPDTEDAAAPDEAAVVIPVLDGDAKKGKRVFAKCKACHKLEKGKNSTGPSLHAIFGRPAGTVEGFKGYSDALLASGIVWDVETLSGFVKKPKEYLDGTNMSFAGLKKDKDILNLLTYLQQNAMPQEDG